jgi:hypothetical protein
VQYILPAEKLPRTAEQGVLWLPTVAGQPVVSNAIVAEVPEATSEARMAPWVVKVLPLTAKQALDLLAACLDCDALAPGLPVGSTLTFWAAALRLAGALVAREQFLPDVEQAGKTWRACWKPTLTGTEGQRFNQLARVMPAACRALTRTPDFAPTRPASAVLAEFLDRAVDALVRSASGDGTALPVRGTGRRKATFESVHDQWLHALRSASKLKQVCNHPAHFLGDNSAIAGRSGKLARLTEMLEEVLQAGDRALVFTHFTEMGYILQRHLQETFGRQVPFLHGGVGRAQRDRMVARFQAGGEGPQVFLLSLKAGGTGLNLTAANHVFHFDRWWNPAVEDQATDRAFRIGQARNVLVHKFLCVGTLEEKIDEMIERKKGVASRVVGTGEAWLTELSDEELRDVFALRQEAMGE